MSDCRGCLPGEVVAVNPLLRLHVCMQRIVLVAIAASIASCTRPAEGSSDPAMAVVPPQDFQIQAGRPVADIEGESRFRNVRQLTFGGQNAEAYFSADGTKLILQRTHPPEVLCDQIFTLDLATGVEQLVSVSMTQWSKCLDMIQPMNCSTMVATRSINILKTEKCFWI